MHSAFLTRLMSNRGMGEILRHDSHWVTSYMTTTFRPNRGLRAYVRWASSCVDTVIVGVSVIPRHVLHWVMTNSKMTSGPNRRMRAVQNWAFMHEDIFIEYWWSSTIVWLVDIVLKTTLKYKKGCIKADDMQYSWSSTQCQPTKLLSKTTSIQWIYPRA